MFEAVMRFVHRVKGIMFKNKITLKIFSWSFGVYILITFLPDLIHLMYNCDFGEPVKKFYSIAKVLSETLVTGSLFTLIHDSLNEDAKIKNKLNNIIDLYKQMKFNILDRMILAEHNFLPPIDLSPDKRNDLIEKIYLNPLKAKEYFMEEQLSKIIFNLGDDEESLRDILREMQRCSIPLRDLNNEFIQNGHADLNDIFNFIENQEEIIEKLLESEKRSVFLNEKCFNPLYLLYCNGSSGKDPILEALLKFVQKFK